MKNVWAIVAVVVILVAGYILSRHYSAKKELGHTQAFRQAVCCDACGKAYITKTGEFPIKCYYCGELNAWSALQCAECNHIFPIVEGRYPDFASRACPKCGKNKLKEVSPNGLEEH